MSAVAPLTFLVPMLCAGVVAVTSPLSRRGLAIVLALGGTTASAVLCAVLLAHTADGTVVEWLGGWQPRDGVAFGIDIAVDRLGAGLALFSAVLSVFAAVLAARLIAVSPPLFHAVALLFSAAIVAFCLTGDLFDLFVFFELMSTRVHHARRGLLRARRSTGSRASGGPRSSPRWAPEAARCA